MPFWRSRSRAQLITKRVNSYKGFEPVQLGLDAFLDDWLPGLRKDGLLVGLNWSGARATGYDVPPTDVAEALAHHLQTRDQSPE
jgi:hypothetical protein